MDTVKASVILEDAERLMRWDLTQLEDTLKADARTALSQALREVWDAWWWEALMTCERTQLRDTYASGTTYAAEAEVYFPPTRKYYQALTATTGNAPAVLTDGVYEVNTRYWIECQMTLEADDYAADTVYAEGTLVRNPADDLYYVRRVNDLTYSGAGHIAFAINGTSYALETAAHSTSDLAGGSEANTGDAYANADWAAYGAVAIRYSPTGQRWVVTDGVFVGRIFATSPTLEGVYTSEYANVTNNPPGTAAFAAAGVPGVDAKWALVNVFDPTLETNRKVRLVSRLNPRTTNNAGAYEFVTTADGILLEEIPEATPWVWARRVTPAIDGDEFSATATYTATPANQLVFDS